MYSIANKRFEIYCLLFLNVQISNGVLRCFHINSDAITMAAKGRSIHTLDSGDPVAEITGMCYK